MKRLVPLVDPAVDVAADRRRARRADHRRVLVRRTAGLGLAVGRAGGGRRAGGRCADQLRRADRGGDLDGQPLPDVGRRRAARRRPALVERIAEIAERGPCRPRSRATAGGAGPGAGTADVAARPLGSDLGQAREAAARMLAISLAALAAAGLDASGRVGDSDPVQAISDELPTFPAREVLLVAGPGARRRRSRGGRPPARPAGAAAQRSRTARPARRSRRPCAPRRAARAPGRRRRAARRGGPARRPRGSPRSSPRTLGLYAGIPDFARPRRREATRSPLSPSRITSFIGGRRW